MVLLIGNYEGDRQQSMQKFGDLMLGGLRAAGVEAELIKPLPFFGNAGASKWLGYLDKYLLFPFRLRRVLQKRPLALVHVCDHSNAVYIKNQESIPFVVTCHDLLAVRGASGEETDCPASLTGRFLQRYILAGLKKASAIACVSQNTARDVERLVRPDAPNQVVEHIPLGLNYDYRPMPDSEAQTLLATVPGLGQARYVLHVGSNLRRKNREGVIRIFALTRENWDGKLVFAGEPLTPELIRLAEQSGVRERILEVVNPKDELLRALYSQAVALIFPSRFEGFGWPIIEAQACGCPVVCSNNAPLPEAAGEGGLLRDVGDETGFAQDLLRLTDPGERSKWTARSLQNAARFSSDKMVARYIELYRRIGAKV